MPSSVSPIDNFLIDFFPPGVSRSFFLTTIWWIPIHFRTSLSRICQTICIWFLYALCIVASQLHKNINFAFYWVLIVLCYSHFVFWGCIIIMNIWHLFFCCWYWFVNFYNNLLHVVFKNVIIDSISVLKNIGSAKYLFIWKLL